MCQMTGHTQPSFFMLSACQLYWCPGARLFHVSATVFQRNLVAQTGDPTGSGKGGESIFRLVLRVAGETTSKFTLSSDL